MHYLFASLVLACVLLAACGGSNTPADGGTSDAGDRVDAGEACDRVSATIGAAGGTLEHCEGARLVVPPGALSTDVEVSIERLDDAPAPFSPYVLAGPAFVFSAPEASFAAPVEVAVPHDGGARMEMAELVDGAWGTLEACDVTETVITQSFRALGTFVALRDPNTYPDSLDGAGEGRIDFTFGDRTDAYEVDPSGYAIDENPGEGRSITVVFRRSADGQLVQVDLRFAISAEGVPEPIQLQHADTAVSEIWGADVFAHPPEDLQMTLTRDEGATIEGTVRATLHLGDATRPFEATFSATTIPYRYPPDRICGELPEG